MIHFLKNLKILKPIATGTQVDDRPIDGIKAVLFDIYGTLLISSSGDIGSINFKEKTVYKVLSEAGIIFSHSDAEENGKLVIQHYEQAIRYDHQEKRNCGIDHPEIEIIHIWDTCLKSLKNTGIIEKTKELKLEHIAIELECLTNPVYPMPGMKDCIEIIKSLDLKLGIISNAQYFTRIIMNYFLKNELDMSYQIESFHPELLIYSYEHHQAKPGLFLYQLMKDRLQKHNLNPEECLYIGNDMLNDIYPASQLGYKTVLFAGDKRSLRLRQERAELKALKPDRVITDLHQLFNILN